EALLSAPTESADAAALAQAITALIAVSTDAQDDTAVRADRSVKNVVSLITVCLTLLAAVLGILKIIAQYAFQTNEQANVNEIVKALQVIDYNYKMAQMELSSGKTLENRHSMAVPGKDGAKA
ncbi:MAG: hypothetical protein IH607_00540, partial [Firmicutes bacterium]|nr:hypothetical protein [Bacillota bacterium]